MRLIKLPDVLSSSFYQLDNKLCARLIAADVCFSDDNVQVRDYDRHKWQNYRMDYDGTQYSLYFHGEGEIEIFLEEFKEKNVELIDESGNNSNFSPDIQYLLVNAIAFGDENRKIRVNRITGTASVGRWDYIDLIGNLETGETTSLKSNYSSRHCLLDDGILLFEQEGDKVLSCYEDDFSLRWTFKPDTHIPEDNKLVHGPEVENDLVFISYGYTHREKIVDPRTEETGLNESMSDFAFHDAPLYALEQTDGSIRWEANFPDSIDNFRVYNGLIYVCSLNTIHILDAESGNRVHVIETGLSGDYNRLSHNKSFLEVAGEYLYFCHGVDACVQLYKLDNYKLAGRLDIPKPYTTNKLLHSDHKTGKVYFLCQWHWEALYGHRSPLLEIDPARINEELEIISGPEADIELKPSSDNPDEAEIWIKIHGAPHDEAMLYAEYHAENLAYYHGSQGRTFGTDHLTDNFNGCVHFRYSGCESPQREIELKMAALKRRFDKWVRDFHAYAATDPSRYATLEVRYDS